ncbi:hypothetical protein HanRHA438_Chr04g0151471 [Helianthus annuus]|nr:hypothetical protein HanRHA438_Chr04g0151471 [Helianthus annuus]
MKNSRPHEDHALIKGEFVNALWVKSACLPIVRVFIVHVLKLSPRFILGHFVQV